MMPQSKALESVKRHESTRRLAIRRHASATVVESGSVRAFDRRSRLTVRSALGGLRKKTSINNEDAKINDDRGVAG